MIALSALPQRVAHLVPADPKQATVEHNGLHVGNVRRVGGSVVAYHDRSDSTHGGSLEDALSWLRGKVRAEFPNADIPEPVAVTEPGLFDLPAAIYHADPVPEGSLSFSRAKVLLEEAGPAKFQHREKCGSEHKPEFDLGTAAHALVLGKGSERLVKVAADSWRSKVAQAERDAAYAAGKTPLLPAQMRQAEDMAEALSRHPLAVATLAGKPEVSMFFQREDGLWLRGQIDALGDECTADYKTTVSAAERSFGKSVWNFRYHVQAAWYRRMRGWLTGEWLPFRIVAQEKAAPYLVSVWEPDESYLFLGAEEMDAAIDTYIECRRADYWPGYPNEIQTLCPPDWAIDDDIEITQLQEKAA